MPVDNQIYDVGSPADSTNFSRIVERYAIDSQHLD